MGSLILLSISTGYYSIVGAVFCTDPLVIFVAAAVLSGSWCMCSLLSVLIALNRCAEISHNSFFKSKFERYTLHMIFLCLIYSIFITLFTTPGLFNSKFVAWFYNPQIGREDRNYVNIYHVVNNFVTVSTTILLYIYLCVKISMQTNLSSIKLTRFESESFLICVSTLAAAFIFIYAQYFPSPAWLVITGTVSWQLCSGISGIIYICVNRSIRSAIVELFATKNIAAHFNAPQSQSWASKTT
ncbi:hypothetical protein Q1695_003877 [Nippostrongylus brasiliensis]|nr:hypothetical protein Q1695_003877 [Nippostrongylus brasiliensis]